MDLTERIKRYLDKVPPAVSGDHGHDQAFTVACALVHGFNLTTLEAEPFFKEYSARCDPPWNEREIRHKLDSAEKTQHSKPRGHLLGTNGASHKPTPQARETITPKVKLATPPDKVEGKPLPKPIEDGARILLQTAFEPTDHVRLVVGAYDEDGKDKPADSGVALKASDWLQRLEGKGGNPNRIFSTTAKQQPGIFIGLNPVKPGGKNDKSVTAFRHALIEFDDIPLEAQWELITSSNIPCAAVIASGGRSVHAWVRINAKDRQEFDERVQVLHATFAEYGVDQQNRNPARLSRLAGCARGQKRQELLATNIGAESFTAWLAERETETGGVEYSADDLMGWRPEHDDKVLLGERFLSQKGSWLVIGQSGIGKSSLAMQAAITFALGKDLFGIHPARPLRQLIVQAENDFGDLAEQFQGVAAGLGIHELSDEMDMLNDRIRIAADATHIGKQFVDFLQRKIDKHAPDIVWIDPLLSFIGDDISRQDVCGRFLREWLNPVAEASGVAWAMMHHTNKPPQDSDKVDWEEFGAYAGTGSAELTNWARATSLLRRDKSGLFKLSFGKRRTRTGIRDDAGKPLSSIWLKQADQGICWHEAEPPAPPAKLAKSAKQPGRTRSAWDEISADPIAFARKICEPNVPYSTEEIIGRAHKAGGPSRAVFRSKDARNTAQREAFLAAFNHDKTTKKWHLKTA